MLEELKNKIAAKILYSEFLIEARFELEDSSYRAGYRKGTRDGRTKLKEEIDVRLKSHSVIDFNDDKLTLGYNQAVAVIKGDVK